MRTLLLGLLVFGFLSAKGVVAAEASKEAKCDAQITFQEDSAKLQDFLATADNSTNAYWIWHCEAFPNDDFHHTDAHSAYDYDYYTAYYRAMNECQYYHHSCHAHCHQDPR